MAHYRQWSILRERHHVIILKHKAASLQVGPAESHYLLFIALGNAGEEIIAAPVDVEADQHIDCSGSAATRIAGHLIDGRPVLLGKGLPLSEIALYGMGSPREGFVGLLLPIERRGIDL